MLKKSLIGAVIIASIAVVVLYDSPSKTRQPTPQTTTSESLPNLSNDVPGNTIAVDKIEQNDQQAKPAQLIIDDEGLVALEPTAGMMLAENDPLLVHAKKEYAKTSMKRGIENYIVPYSKEEADSIYGSNSGVYRVMEDANGQWHLFPFNYMSAYMFSQSEQQKYLEGAPESPLEIKHDYIESAIENVVYMHGANDLDVTCNNNICIGAFNRPEGAPTMWIIGDDYADERMNEVIDRDPYVVGIMNCDIIGAKPIAEEPKDKKDCYIELRAVYDPQGS